MMSKNATNIKTVTFLDKWGSLSIEKEGTSG